MCELRRGHPRWGPRRIAYEFARTAAEGSAIVSRSAVHRILRYHGLIEPGRWRRRTYTRWERQALMQLWQIGIVGGVRSSWMGRSARW